jgi:hypothetical protein
MSNGAHPGGLITREVVGCGYLALVPSFVITRRPW